MRINFIVNDYILIWNLLFQASISETIYKIKQRIWETYKNEYNLSFNDKEQILEDYKNFIPNNDTIYNILLENKDYEKIKKQAEKYRNEVMGIWDKNKKEIDYLYKKIIRRSISDYTAFIINKEFSIIDHPKEEILVLGKEIEKKEPLKILLGINMAIINSNIKNYKEEDEILKKVIIELAIINELPTRITGRSYYQLGNPKLSAIKRWIYPYWLMYLGVKKEELHDYMMRDKIVFDTEKYNYEKELKNIDIEEFIDFCIRNKKYILRENTLQQQLTQN